jgi:hypothetical protein
MGELTTLDEAGLPLADTRSQHIYWYGSVVLNTVGALSVSIVIREYLINKALRAHSLLPFVGQILADLMWCIAYVSTCFFQSLSSSD